MTDRERPGAGDLEPVRARSIACHCGRTVEPRSPDPWDGRMDDYCYDCASNRCDCYPDECPVKYPQGSSAATVESDCMDASFVLDWLKQTGAPENIVALQEKVVEAAGGYISGADRVRPW